MVSRVRWACSLLLIGLSVACASRLASNAPEAPAKHGDVHPSLFVPIDPPPSHGVAAYTRVEGTACLQPRIINGQPTAYDLETARDRWLAEHYPGYRLRRESHLLTLAPEYGGPTEPAETGGPGCTFVFETSNGELIEECFSRQISVESVDNEH